MYRLLLLYQTHRRAHLVRHQAQTLDGKREPFGIRLFQWLATQSAGHDIRYPLAQQLEGYGGAGMDVVLDVAIEVESR
jgi:hypothetical protein